MWILAQEKKCLVNTKCIYAAGKEIRAKDGLTNNETVVLAFYDNYDELNKIWKRLTRAIKKGKRIFKMPKSKDLEKKYLKTLVSEFKESSKKENKHGK